MRVIGYIRVSTDAQDASGLGLADQERKIKSYCETYDHSLVSIFKDAASGKNMERSGLQKALEALRNGKADGLIVAKLDRLTRSVRDMGLLLDKYFRQKYAFFVVAEQIDTTTASGRLVLNGSGKLSGSAQRRLWPSKRAGRKRRGDISPLAMTLQKTTDLWRMRQNNKFCGV